MTNITILSVNMTCDKCKRAALHSITKTCGIDEIKVNMREKTITVLGDADPVCMLKQLKKKFHCADLLYSGPKQEPKPEPKPKPDPKPPKPNPDPPEPNPDPPEPPKHKPDPPPKHKPDPPEPPKPKPDPPEPPKPKPEPKPEPHKPQDRIVCKNYPPHCPVHPNRPPHCCGCPACSNRPDILWPRWQPPMAHPDEVWYVWNEENQNSCTIC